MSDREATPPGPLARRDDEPVFDEPWQALALALAFNLVERGVFSAPAWSDALGAELVRAQVRGEPDDPHTYYRSVLAALEGLLDGEGRISAPTLEARTEAWRRAYLSTPHGQPVELSAGDVASHRPA